MKRKTTLGAMVVAGSALGGGLTGSLQAAAIPVPNFSFESPGAANMAPYATSSINNWIKSGNTDSSGCFYNTTTSAVVDNADGNNLAFIFANPGTGLHQELTATYLVGKSYQAEVGIEGGGFGMPIGTPLELRLYYVNGTSGNVTIATGTYLNNNTGPITHLAPLIANLGVVGAGDPWKDKPIGIELISTDSPTVTETGYFDLDNVKLTEVPEPTAVGAFVVVAGLSGLRRVRRRPA